MARSLSDSLHDMGAVPMSVTLTTPHFEIYVEFPPGISSFTTRDIVGRLHHVEEEAPGHKCRVIRRGKSKSGIKRRTIHVPVESFGAIDKEGELESFLAGHFDEWAEAYAHKSVKNPKKPLTQGQDYSGWQSIPLTAHDSALEIIESGGDRFWLANGCGLDLSELGESEHLAAKAISPKVILRMLWYIARNSPLVLKVKRIPGGPQCDSIRLEDFIQHHAEYLIVNCGEDRNEVELIREEALNAISSRRADERDWQLAVRIIVPEGKQTHWQCELCGVASDDPSAVLAADHEAANRLTKAQRERLLTVINRESDRVKSVWKPLTRIVQPVARCEITVTEVCDLLTRVAGELDEAGVRVQLPKTLVTGDDADIKKKVTVTDDGIPRKPGVLKKDVILKFQVELAVDGESLSPEELQELASIREPLIKVRGKWVYIDPTMKGELEKIAQEVLDHSVRPISETEAVGMALTNEVQDATGANTIPTDVTLDAEGLQELLGSFRSGNPPEIALPKGLDAELRLRPYQLHGLNWLAMIGDYGLGGCLADDMGLGKTLQTLAWLQHRKESGIKEPALLICPTSVLTNWEKEAKRFTPKLRVFRQHGPNRPDDDMKFFARARKESTDLVITSFGTMCQDLELFLNVSWQWSAVILDEAQNIKNPDTAQSKAARQLSSHAATRLALTGTPVENGPRDLWPIMEFLNPGMLGTWSEYVKNDASPIEHGKDSDHRQRLNEKIEPFKLRRMKTDPGIAPELPRKIEKTVWCSLTREQAEWYQASLNKMKAALESTDKKERQGAILRTCTSITCRKLYYAVGMIV